MRSKNKRRTAGGRATAEESKAAILKAAAEVFPERGYLKTTMRAIARRAGISVGGIYLYYKNKKELYTLLLCGQREAFCERCAGIGKERPEEALRTLMDCYFEYAVKRPKLIAMHLKEFDLEFKRPFRQEFFDSQRRLVLDILRRGVKQGVFREDAARKETAEAILSGIRGLVLTHISGVGEFGKYRDALYRMILKGIGK